MLRQNAATPADGSRSALRHNSTSDFGVSDRRLSCHRGVTEESLGPRPEPPGDPLDQPRLLLPLVSSPMTSAYICLSCFTVIRESATTTRRAALRPVPPGATVRGGPAVAGLRLPGRRRPRPARAPGYPARRLSGRGRDGTGPAFVRDGITGVLVERLPPGARCATNDSDAAALGYYLESLRRAMELDRRSVRAAASDEFATDRVAGQVLMVLDELRTCMREA